MKAVTDRTALAYDAQDQRDDLVTGENKNLPTDILTKSVQDIRPQNARLLTRDQAAAYCGVTSSTFDDYRSRGMVLDEGSLPADQVTRRDGQRTDKKMRLGNSNIATPPSEHNSDYFSSKYNNVAALKTPRLFAPRGLARTDAAFYIGCSPRTFDGMVNKGEMPSPRLIGAKKIWDKDELDEFFADLPRPQTNSDKNDWEDGR